MVRFVSPEQIERIVCETYGVSMEEIYAYDTVKRIDIARHMLVYLLRKDLDMRSNELAARLKRTHAIASISYNKAMDILFLNKSERDKMDVMRWRLRQLRKNNCQDFWPVAS